MSKAKHPWHPADVLCALTKQGLSYAEVARRHDLNRSAVANAASRPNYSAETAIASELGVPAHQIWPDRYDDRGLPLHKMVRRRLNAHMAAQSRLIRDEVQA
ncbi:hypothetical protein AN189_12915 [Loktanella sp. 3ANDIMAR09]|uniref:helix-turn-helix domain-containing protein n=1 Tax=Loktanella sp. 3ANDIMAR09 TaxID=1225657 RepID=UPI0006F5DFAB|nr:hypothetical protein AN189_12915 [Loktanella sp. 3ANDIMAR09]